MRGAKCKTERIILLILFFVYFMVLFKITLFRDFDLASHSINLIPFVTILGYVKSIFRGNKIISILNIAGNIILFIPLGYMSALLFQKMRKLTRMLIFVVVFSVLIEVCQYIFVRGAADIDDVILNALGGVAGYWGYYFALRLFKSKKHAIYLSVFMTAIIGLGSLSSNNYRFLLPVPGNLPARAESRGNNEALNEDFDEPPDDPLAVDSAAASDTGYDIHAASVYASQNNTDKTAWCLVLVNKWNAISDDYEVDLMELSNGQLVDKRIYPALQEMFDTARNDGVYPVAVSGYRTAETQQRLMDEKIAEYIAEGYAIEEAKANAEAWVAMPGTSEHQLGIAVDINADGIHSAGYEVYDWLAQNAYLFGFICRYPADKTEITGVINEPWHYRYVGIEAAAEMYNQAVCLEEYLNGAGR